METDSLIDKILTLPSFQGAKHTIVFFKNNSTACSCKSTTTFNTPPSLRPDDICPECRSGKHINCTFEMINEHDLVVDCQCSCRNP